MLAPHVILHVRVYSSILGALHTTVLLWQMKFNTNKCHTMRITLHCNTINTDYHLRGSTLSMVSQYPHLGVTMSNTMLWQNHINGITACANKMLGLIRRRNIPEATIASLHFTSPPTLRILLHRMEPIHQEGGN